MRLLHQIGAKALDRVFRRSLEHVEEVFVGVGVVNRDLITTSIQMLIVGAVYFTILLFYVEWIQFLLMTFLFTIVSADLEVLFVHSINVGTLFSWCNHFFTNCIMLLSKFVMS